MPVFLICTFSFEPVTSQETLAYSNVLFIGSVLATRKATVVPTAMPIKRIMDKSKTAALFVGNRGLLSFLLCAPGYIIAVSFLDFQSTLYALPLSHLELLALFVKMTSLVGAPCKVIL